MNLQNWFMGVVEDDSDPEERGRVKVRCYGYHTPDHNLLPTKDLPYVQTIHPVTAGPAAGGSGESPSPLLNSIVFGVFYDGDDMQDALILGVLPGGPLPNAQFDPATNFGFGTPAPIVGGGGGSANPRAGQASSSPPPLGTATVGNNDRDPFHAHKYLEPGGSSAPSSPAGGAPAPGPGSSAGNIFTRSDANNQNTFSVEVGDVTRGAARFQKIDPELLGIINTAAARTGLGVIYFSGGQMPLAEYNSYEPARKSSYVSGGVTYYTLDGNPVRVNKTKRHDVDEDGNGQAADVWLIDEDGRRIRLDLDADHPDTKLAGNFLEEARALGAQGIGGGGGSYMGGVGMHVDISSKATWSLNPAFKPYLKAGDKRNAAGETLPQKLPRVSQLGAEEFTIGEISLQIIEQGIYDYYEEPWVWPEGAPHIETAEKFHEWATSRGSAGITVNMGSNHNIQEGTILINTSMFGCSAEFQKVLVVTNPAILTMENILDWGEWYSYNLGSTGRLPASGLPVDEIPPDTTEEPTAPEYVEEPTDPEYLPESFDPARLRMPESDLFPGYYGPAAAAENNGPTRVTPDPEDSL